MNEFIGKMDGERNMQKAYQCPHCVLGYNSLKTFRDQPV